MFSKRETQKVKGIAILLLFFHHLFYSAARVQASGVVFRLIPYSAIQDSAVAARVCVWIFFFLSAYGLTVQYAKGTQSAPQFVWKRWFSLIKPFWYAYAVVALLYWAVVGAPLALKYKGSFLHMFLDFMAWADLGAGKCPMLIAVWWYMTLAQIQVVILPVLYWVCRKLRWWACAVFFAVLFVIPDVLISPYGGRYFNYLLVMVMGVLCAQERIFDRIPQPRGRGVRVLVFLAELGAMAGLLALRLKITDTLPWQVGGLLSGIVCVLLCLMASEFFRTGAVARVLQFLGKYSGTMFMVHAFFYTYVPSVVYWSKDPLLSYLTLLALSLLLAMGMAWVRRTWLAFAAKRELGITVPPLGENAVRFSPEDTRIQKGVAVLLLLGIHTFVRSDPSLYFSLWTVGGKPWLNPFFYNEKICVTMFVLLSGFGLNESYNRFRRRSGGENPVRRALRFVRKHLLNLWTNFWVIFIVFAGLGLALHRITLQSAWGGNWLSVLVDFLGLQDVVFDFWRTPTLNPTWWYMSTIIVYYLIFPAVKALMNKLTYLPVLVGAALTVYAPYAAQRQFKTGFFFYFLAFAVGMLFSEKHVLDRAKNIQGRRWVRILLAAVLVLVTFFLRIGDKYRMDLPHALSMMYLTDVVFAQARWQPARRFMAFLGSHSSNIFMLHTFFIVKYFSAFMYSLKYPVLIYTVLLALSLASSVCIEWLKRKLGFYPLQKKICG